MNQTGNNSPNPRLHSNKVGNYITPKQISFKESCTENLNDYKQSSPNIEIISENVKKTKETILENIMEFTKNCM